MWVVLIHIHDVCVYQLLVAIITASRTGCRVVSRTLRGCVTLCCRLLVIMRLLCLVILVFEECLELHGGVLLFVAGCLLLRDRYVWSYWFLKDVLNLVGVCYSFCRLLVIMQSLHLVVLVFKGCLKLHGGVLLFVAGCLLLRDHYIWLYWFSKDVSNLAGVCYSFCRLLVIARSLRLVVLVFEECLKLSGVCYSFCRLLVIV